MKRPPLNKSYRINKDEDSVTFMVHKDVKKHLEEGKRLFDIGDTSGALAHYKATLAIDSECALVHFNLGFAFYEHQDRESAKACYKKAIELEPCCSLFLEHLAKLDFENEDYKDAIALFQRAETSGQIQPVSYGLWGRCHYELEEYQPAIEQLNKMLAGDLSPTLSGYARFYLVLSCLGENRFFRMRIEMEKMLAMYLPDSELLADLGEQLLDAKCITLAKRCLERFLENQEDMSVQHSYEEIVEIEQRVDHILPRLFSGDEEHILQNIHLLFQFGSEKVACALTSIQNAHSALIREAVVEYHRRYGYLFGGDLLRLLSDDTGFVRDKCAQYIYESRDEKYMEEARMLLQDSSSVTRRYATQYLRDMSNMDVLPKLTQAMVDEQDQETLRQMRLAAAAIKIRCQKQEHEMISELLPPDHTPQELLEPIDYSPVSSNMTRGIWLALIILCAFVLIFTLLSF